MWDFSIGGALGMMGRTLPFILLRIAAYFRSTMGYILVTGTGAGIGCVIGGFVDEVILAHTIRTRSNNAWGAAREALVFYGQNCKVMLKNAAWLALIVYGLSFLVFLPMLAPVALVVCLTPGAWVVSGVVFALLFAWAVKAALIEPFAIASMMQVFFHTVESQQPNPTWVAQLEQTSGKFRKLKERALGAAGKGMPDISRTQCFGKSVWNMT